MVVKILYPILYINIILGSFKTSRNQLLNKRIKIFQERRDDCLSGGRRILPIKRSICVDSYKIGNVFESLIADTREEKKRKEKG